MFRRLSVLIGLTETEIKVLIFIVTTFLLGAGYRIFFQQDDFSSAKIFDYSKEDSLFFNPELPEEDKSGR
jgi:hypothetical protein